MKKVTMYKTNDGTVFDTEAEATKHEKIFELGEWYDNNPLFGDGTVDFEDLLEWCQDNKAKVKEMLAVEQ